MFDQKRLLTLAGISDKDTESNLLNEGVEQADDADAGICAGESEVDEADDVSTNDAEQLDEIRVRNFIRSEIRSMLNNMRPNDKRNWILRGQRTSSNSQSGQISRGWVGPGFVK